MDEEDQINGEIIDVDQLLRSLKKTGKFQIKQIIFLTLNWLIQGMNILSIIFIGFIPDYQCRPYANSSEWPEDLRKIIKSNESNVSLEYGECHVTVSQNGESNNNLSFPCTNGYIYSRPADLSFITEWDLVCDKAAVGALSQTFLTIGMGAGASLIPHFADRYGRRPVVIICLFGIWAFSLGLGFSPSYNVFMALRFMIGFFQQGLGITVTTLSVELFPTEYRAFISMLCGVGWSISCILMTPLAYALQNRRWRHLAIVISCMGSVVFFDICFLEESIRWLLAKNNMSRAEKIVKRVAKVNGVNFDGDWQNFVVKCPIELDTMTNNHNPQHQHQQEFTDEEIKKTTFSSPPSTAVEDDDKIGELLGSKPLITDVKGSGKKASISTKPKKAESAFNLVTNRILRFIMAIQIFTWFINALTYYGLFLTSSSLAGDRFLNFFLIALSELLSLIVMWKAFAWFGRKKSIVMFLSIAICSLLTATAVNILVDRTSKYFIISTVASMIGMFGISGSFNGLWAFLPELIPTKYRGAALGMASSAARVGSALSPFTAFLIRFIIWGPGVIFSAGCLLANFLIMMLPETRGRQLPQNIDDVKAWMKKSRKIVNKSDSYSKITQQ